MLCDHRLGRVSASPHIRIGYACKLPPGDPAGALHDALTRHLAREPGGQSLSGVLQTYADGSEWLLVGDAERVPWPFLRALAAELGRELSLIEARVDDAEIERLGALASTEQTPEDAWRVTKKTIAADGAVRQVAGEIELTFSEHDAFDASIDEVLLEIARGDGAPTQVTSVTGFIRTPLAQPLSEPLVAIATLILEAGRYSVVEIAGRRMVRVVTADGTRHVAVSDEDLRALVAATGIAPLA